MKVKTLSVASEGSQFTGKGECWVIQAKEGRAQMARYWTPTSQYKRWKELSKVPRMPETLKLHEATATGASGMAHGKSSVSGH